jgi:hypothetical protein
MLNRSHWRIVARIMLVAVPLPVAVAQSAGALRLGVGQQVRIATRDGAALAGNVRAASDTNLRLRVRGFAGDSIVIIAREEIDHAEVAVPQDYSEQRALIGGVAGFAIGALAGLALNKSESCQARGECWKIDFFPLASTLGFTAGLLAGWFHRPDTWVSASL